jgi:hypothetical protein
MVRLCGTDAGVFLFPLKVGDDGILYMTAPSTASSWRIPLRSVTRIRKLK